MAVTRDCLLKCSPDMLREPLPVAHASQEVHKRVTSLEPLRAPQLKNMLDAAEDFDCMLHFDAWRFRILVAAVLIPGVHVFDETDVRRRSEL